jgi:hypothetical protein
MQLRKANKKDIIHNKKGKKWGIFLENIIG